MRMSRRMGVAGGESPFELEYTGTHTVSQVVSEGILWQQWTLTGSGILRLVKGKAPPAKVWLCAGGSNGTPSGSGAGTASRGGLGAYAAYGNGVEIFGEVAVAIGAGGSVSGGTSGSTSFGGLTAQGVRRQDGATAQYQGGTGGGCSLYGSNKNTAPDLGDGISKIPFGDAVNFAGQPHCGGGGSAGVRAVPLDSSYSLSTDGGDGGSDGGDGTRGAANAQGTNVARVGGDGGVLGGGKGGHSPTSAGLGADTSTDATFYGGGGGAKGYYRSLSTVHSFSGVRAGYQGVVYVRVPMGTA